MNLIFVILFVIGYGIIGTIGTRDQMVFQWPGYLVLGALGILTVTKFNRGRSVGTNHVCLLVALLFSVYIIIRAWFSPVSYFARVEGFLLLSALLTYLLITSVLYRTKSRATIVGFLAVLLLGNVMVGVYHLVNDPEFMILPGYTRAKPFGAGGFFNNYNHLGGFLELVTPFLLAFTLLGKLSQSWRLLTGFLGAVGIAGIGMTASRGTYLSFSVSLLVLGVLCLYLVKGLEPRRFKSALRFTLVVLFVVILPAMFLASKALDKRFRGASGNVQMVSGVSVRMNSWNLAVEQWKASPVFGTGSRTYDQHSIRLWPRHVSRQHGHPEFTHNDYLQLLAEYGLVGLALGLAFYFIHMVSGMVALTRYRKRAGTIFDSRLALLVGAIAAGTACGVHSFVDFNLHLPANAIPLAFAMAILANPGLGWSDIKPVRIPGLALVPHLTIPLVGLFFLASWKMAPGEYFLEQGARIDINREHDAVIQKIERSLSYDTRNPVSYRLLGVALMLKAARTENGDYNLAVKAFKRGLELQPHDIFSLVGLGRSYMGLSQFANAKEAFLEAQEWGPFEVDPHLWYAHLLMEQGIWQSDVGDVDGAIQLTRLAVPSYERAYSVQPFQKSTAWKEGYLEAMACLGVLYEIQGSRILGEAAGAAVEKDFGLEIERLRAALDAFQKAIAHTREAAGNPEGFQATEILGESHEVVGRLLVERLRQHPEFADQVENK
ncbi:MAG: O-antigen ligase [Verrucomicrobiales bacterium]|jgi:O-antigen ligase